jgi:hypothetical protein
MHTHSPAVPVRIRLVLRLVATCALCPTPVKRGRVMCSICASK